MIDFSEFDALMDPNLAEDVKNTPDFDEVADGNYIVKLDSMEIKKTKDNKKLMFAVQCSIIENADGSQCKFKGRKIFFYRVIQGNKVTEKWNDIKAIKSVITWISKLGIDDLEFINYSDFAGQILDIFQDIQGTVELDIEYKAEDFNPISIKEVYDVV